MVYFENVFNKIVYTVFDLISGLFACVILGKKFFVVSTVSVHYVISSMYCLRLSRVQNAEGRKEGNIFLASIHNTR